MSKTEVVDLNGQPAGIVIVPADYTTKYIGGAVGETYRVSDVSALEVLTPRLPTAGGFQQLYAVAIEGESSDYTVSSYYGVATITNIVTGQVLKLSLPKPPAGLNNYGIDVSFSDGSISLTSHLSNSGSWTVWATRGVPLGGDTQGWYNPGATPLPATGFAPALSLAAWVASNPSVLNAQDNTAHTIFPEIYTVTEPVDHTTQAIEAALGSTFAVGQESVVDLSVSSTPAGTGFQQLYAVAVDGNASDYQVSRTGSIVKLTSTVSGKVINMALPQPPAGANNYGVDVKFTDGSVSFTTHKSPAGNVTLWATRGVPLNGNTQEWVNAGATAIPLTGSEPALNLGTWIAANPSVLNAADNSSKVVFPTAGVYAVTGSVYAGTSAGDAFNATDGTLSSTTSITDVGVNDSLNITVLTGGFGAALNTDGVSDINVTNTTSNYYLLNAENAEGIETVSSYQSSGTGTVAFGNLQNLVTVAADGTTNGVVSAAFKNSVVQNNSTVTLNLSNGAVSSFAVGSQDGASVFRTVNIESEGIVTNTVGLIQSIVNGASGNATSITTYKVLGSGSTDLTVSYSTANGVIDASTATGFATLKLASTAGTVNTIKGSNAATVIDVSAVTNYLNGTTARTIIGASESDKLIIGQDLTTSSLTGSTVTGIDNVTGNVGAGGVRVMNASALTGLSSVGFYNTGASAADVATFTAQNLSSGQSVVAGRAVAAGLTQGDNMSLALNGSAGATNSIDVVLNNEVLSTLTVNDSAAAAVSTLGFDAGLNNYIGSVVATLNASNTTQIDISSLGGSITLGSTAFNAAALTEINISGNRGATLGGGTSSVSNLATIDAHGLTGDLTIAALNYNSAANITGGSGSNSIYWNLNNQTQAVLNGGVHAVSSAARNTLNLAGTANTGITVIDLTRTDDQVTSVNGGANSAIQKNFQNVNADSLSGSFGVNVTAGAKTVSIVGTHQDDILAGNAAGGMSFNGNGGADVINLGLTRTLANTVVANLSYTLAETDLDVNGFVLDTASTRGDNLVLGSTTFASGVTATGWSVSNGIFSYTGGGTGGLSGFEAAIASATTKGIGAYYDGSSTFVIYSPDATVSHQTVVELVGVHGLALDTGGSAVAGAIYVSQIGA